VVIEQKKGQVSHYSDLSDRREIPLSVSNAKGRYLASNIAEGQARHTTKEFVQFVSHAEG
jgi:hypothetical protein